MTSFQPTQAVTDVLKAVTDQSDMMHIAASRHSGRAADHARSRMEAAGDRLGRVWLKTADLGSPVRVGRAWVEYARDASQRVVLTADALRLWSDTVIDHNARGAPPVLVYDSELILDGATLPRPCNYFLLRILPPEGVVIDEALRPFVIIDPRAGHGAGIGGFKKDSQVGVALRGGHPVYFVGFRQMPEPGQTLARVTEAEAAFLREVARRHPQSPKPVVIGNCQGGWATAILAATNPDLTGPIVLNGAPMSYWAGKLGQDPMRYSGGLAGGVTPAMLAGDMAGGIFDGAELVANFEMLNPARNWFGKYFDLYREVDTGVERFLEFEKWWGGFYLMTTDEIQWIVENLFVGNKLATNRAQIEPGRNIDLKQIQAPVICFASHGDNITPPAQALNWIIDTYSDELEIEIRGQRILYMVHEQVGHLGIFVSSSVANREHSQMAETLANIEALPPGLYEIVIEDVQGQGQAKSFKLSIARRKFADLLAQTGDRREEAAFAAVARASEDVAEAYDATIRPVVKAMASAEIGDLRRQLHPMRMVRTAFGSGTPGMNLVADLAHKTRAERAAADPENPFLEAEALWGDLVENAWNTLRDGREAAIELAFLGFYLTPAAIHFGAKRRLERTKKDPKLLPILPEVQMLVNRAGEGGLAEAIIRMLILVAGTRHDTRADRLSRSMETMHHRAPLSLMSVDERVRLIHAQTVIAHFAPREAVETLPRLLRSRKEREDAMAALRYVVGAEEEMVPATREMIVRLAVLLQLQETPGPSAAAAE